MLIARASYHVLNITGLGIADGAIGDKFAVTANGVTKTLTEIEARDVLTQKVKAATEAGKGLDVERRGQFNEKALFSVAIMRVKPRGTTSSQRPGASCQPTVVSEQPALHARLSARAGGLLLQVRAEAVARGSSGEA